MTVPATQRKAGPYTGNGSATSFSFAFKVNSASDVQVSLLTGNVETVLTTNYVVVPNIDQEANPGGSVTYPVSGAPLASPNKIFIRSGLQLAQTTSLPEGGRFVAQTVEGAIDRTVMMIGQLDEKISRSLTISGFAPSANPVLPMPMANSILGWDSGGVNLINYTATGAPYSAASITYNPGFSGAVPVTVEARLRGTVDVMSFGAVGNKVADDSDAVEAAIAYAISVGKDLYMSNMCKVTRTININRLVDSGPADKYFTIWGGGGLYCDTAVTIFGTSLPYSGNPNSQLVRFHNISFECSAPEITAYAIDGNKFLRTIFDSVSFLRIKCLVASTYTQSIYLYNCNSRRWLGSFFHCLHGNYDLQVIGGLYEAGQTCFDLVYPRGSKFYTQIEGMQEWALKLAGCSAVHISCYFEDNGTDFDCRNSNYPNKGVNIQNCFVVRSGGPGFIWGTADACISEGNYSTGNGTYTLHDLQSDSNVSINDFSDRGAVGLSNEDAISHSGYRQGNLTSLGLRTSGSASYTVTNLVGSYVRMGKHITVQFKCTLTSNATHGAADAAYIVSGLPGVAENVDMVCGVITVGTASSTMELINVNPPRPLSLTTVVPSNVSGNAFDVSGSLTYFAT